MRFDIRSSSSPSMAAIAPCPLGHGQPAQFRRVFHQGTAVLKFSKSLRHKALMNSPRL